MQGRCMKCKEQRDFAEGSQEVPFGKKKNRKAMKGPCAVCGTTMFKILPSKKK